MNNNLFFLGLCASLGAFGCSASSNDNLSKPPSGTGGSAAEGAGGATGSGGGSGSGIVGGSGGSNLAIKLGDASPGAAGSTGSPEICDGIDNDGNGIVDDVDVGKDGVCDCLNIATIGEIGPWGMGGTGIFAGWLSARSPLGAVALGNQVLTDDLLKKFQVIVTLHTQPVDIAGMRGVARAYHPFADGEIQAFTKWIKAGGGAMATIGYNYGGTHEEVNINKLFSPLGITYKTDGYINGFITSWVDHPVTRGVHNIKTLNGVEVNSEGIVLAHESPPKVAFQGIEVGSGHALMWGDEWITYDELWTDVKDQQVERLWLNILKWLTPPKQCQVPIPDRVN